MLSNIAYSRPEATREEIEEAVKLSGSSEFINKLENGLETVIGESGKKLSGGERQKISIARAILKDSDVIILDEATSHLDSKSTKRIGSLLKERFKDKMCIIISHRSLNITNINKTFILNEGVIEETKN